MIMNEQSVKQRLRDLITRIRAAADNYPSPEFDRIADEIAALDAEIGARGVPDEFQKAGILDLSEDQKKEITDFCRGLGIPLQDLMSVVLKERTDVSPDEFIWVINKPPSPGENPFREIRKARGLTQTEAGDRIGVTKQMISQYEVGTRRPGLDVLQSLARAYGVVFEVHGDRVTWRDKTNNDGRKV